ncbi:choline dehydrogenase flavo [Fusarium albosuccineum]|uniref:Choline dehydrogenase flavo n=1 Tax=Fusarium albosuccineum TaxID=1237068 RepID=A0A8H4L0C5_9HYPO|nr:choline dehydrogenase flavo [Fusarium albosuccineum]
MDHLLHLDTDIVCLQAKLNAYDYIIVGSGFGGGPIAEDLAGKGKKVLLIERGGVIFSTHVLNTSRPFFNRGASNSPEGNERVYDAVKAKVQCTDTSETYVGGPVYCIGGRTNLWGIWIPEVGPETLDLHFPKEVKDYLKGDGYKNAFDFVTDESQKEGVYPLGPGAHEVSSEEINDVKVKLNSAIQSSSFDLMPVAAGFNAPAPYKFSQGAFSTTLAIMNRMYANDPCLSVLIDTEVVAVHGENGSVPNKTVHALKIRDKKTGTIKELVVGKAKVILSAGTIGTASIALNSGLQQLNPLVGKGLIDHNVCYLRFAKEKDGDENGKPLTKKPLNLKTHMKVGGEECLVTVTINANFFLAGSSATIDTTHFYDNNGQLVKNPTKKYIDKKEYDTICVLFEFVGKLDNGNSVLSIPGLDPVLDIRRAPLTTAVQCDMEKIVRSVRDIFVESAHTSNGCADPGLRPQHMGFGVFSHECGTMRMDSPKLDDKGAVVANDLSQGVVDTDLKFHGLDNLWVCDLSVFPVSPEANPSLTLAALALRLAEHLEPKQPTNGQKSS